MNELINSQIGNLPKTMSSLEISELTGKNHADVMRDIRVMLEQAEIGLSKFAYTYLNSQNKKQPCFHLPRRECDLLISGYSVKYRLAIIDRWQELEAKEHNKFVIPQTLGDALILAGNLAKQNEAQTLIIQEQAPKVDYANAVLNCKESIQLGAFCKQVGLGRNKLMKLMRDDKILIAGGVLYNTPYQQFIDAGYFEVEKSVSKNNLHQGLTTYITGKGELWLCKRLNLSKKWSN